MSDWADEILRERKRLGITIDQCAWLLQCSPMHYSALEHGKTEPSPREVSSLAWYFKRYAEVKAADTHE